MVGLVVEVLTRAECLSYLRSTSLGRLGASVGALPTIMPVHFGILNDAIVLRLTSGSLLATAARGVVAFEADGLEPDGRTAWSVLIQGVASAMVDHEGITEARRSIVGEWAPSSETDHFVVIEPRNISGRRVLRTD